MISGNCRYTGVAKTYRGMNCFFRESQFTDIPVISPTPPTNFAWRKVHNHMLMHHSVALDNLSKTISLIDSNQKVSLLHALFKGTTLFGSELAKLHRANKEHASSVTVYPAATPQSYTTKPYPGHGRSFRKGGQSYRKCGMDRDHDPPLQPQLLDRPSLEPIRPP